MPRISTLTSVSLLLLCSGLLVDAQEKPAYKIWEGVYTEAQAMRGQKLYEDHCASCHGSDLSGGDGPGLVGGNFARAWSSRYLDRLYKKIRDRMPADDVMAISDEEKVDIVAYLLEFNGFPAGKAELPHDVNYMTTIQVVGRNGPEPAPAGSMVEVLGCLTGDDKGWKLTNATEPAVTTMDDPDGDAKAAVKQALGKDTVGLLDVFPSPAEHKGRKMLAKGLLIRNNGLALNVLHIGLVGTACAP